METLIWAFLEKGAPSLLPQKVHDLSYADHRELLVMFMNTPIACHMCFRGACLVCCLLTWVLSVPNLTHCNSCLTTVRGLHTLQGFLLVQYVGTIWSSSLLVEDSAQFSLCLRARRKSLVSSMRNKG